MTWQQKEAEADGSKGRDSFQESHAEEVVGAFPMVDGRPAGPLPTGGGPAGRRVAVGWAATFGRWSNCWNAGVVAADTGRKTGADFSKEEEETSVADGEDFGRRKAGDQSPAGRWRWWPWTLFVVVPTEGGGRTVVRQWRKSRDTVASVTEDSGLAERWSCYEEG